VAALGFALGVAAMLSELPNSLFKRQLGIDPGAAGPGAGSALFYLLDQVDLLLGTWLIAWPWVAPTVPRVLWSILFAVVVHQLISSLGVLLGMRTSAR
jgi:hypothetical protein